jgi:hypothetical protein
LAVAKRSVDLDPASPPVSHSLAVQLSLARQFDNAIAQSHKTLELDPNFAPLSEELRHRTSMRSNWIVDSLKGTCHGSVLKPVSGC